MLVLSRKPGERILIGSDVTVTVLDVSGKLVKIGIEAPEDTTVLRAEIREQVERENRLAAAKSGYFGYLRDLRSFLRTSGKQKS